MGEWVRAQGREDASIRAWCCISRFEGRQVNNNEARSEQLPSTPSVWNRNLLLSREPSRPSDLCSGVTWTCGSGRWKGAEEKRGDKGLILRLGGRLRGWENSALWLPPAPHSSSRILTGVFYFIFILFFAFQVVVNTQQKQTQTVLLART